MIQLKIKGMKNLERKMRKLEPVGLENLNKRLTKIN